MTLLHYNIITCLPLPQHSLFIFELVTSEKQNPSLPKKLPDLSITIWAEWRWGRLTKRKMIVSYSREGFCVFINMYYILYFIAYYILGLFSELHIDSPQPTVFMTPVLDVNNSMHDGASIRAPTCSSPCVPTVHHRGQCWCRWPLALPGLVAGTPCLGKASKKWCIMVWRVWDPGWLWISLASDRPRDPCLDSSIFKIPPN